MLLVSYNVASWTTTLREILSQFGSLTKWLDLLRIDILCLQETKITREKLTQSPDHYGAVPDGWDSFWSCCRTIKKGAQGFNGVATYARKGLTTRAESEVFGQSHLDRQGRCIMTQHGDIVIFNVYAPTGGHDTKQEFHQQLTLKMREQRNKGMRVILAGDLNVTRRKEDVVWHSRMLNLQLLVDILNTRLNGRQDGKGDERKTGQIGNEGDFSLPTSSGMENQSGLQIAEASVRDGKSGTSCAMLTGEVNIVKIKAHRESEIAGRDEEDVQGVGNDCRNDSTGREREVPCKKPQSVTNGSHVTEISKLCKDHVRKNGVSESCMCKTISAREISENGIDARGISGVSPVPLEKHTARRILAALPQTIELLKGLKVLEVPGSKKPKEYTRKTTSYKIESECGKKWLGKRYESAARAAGSFMVGEWDDVSVPPVPDSVSTTGRRIGPVDDRINLSDVHVQREADNTGTADTGSQESIRDAVSSIDQPLSLADVCRTHTHTPKSGSCDVEECRHELTIKQWAECLEKGGGLVLSERELYSLAAFGCSYSSDFNQKWVNDLIVDDEMVDSFTAFHPQARERFTCFEQYTNRRYYNEGARIDFIMVDKPLFHQCAVRGHALQGKLGPENAVEVRGIMTTKIVVANSVAKSAVESTIIRTPSTPGQLAPRSGSIPTVSDFPGAKNSTAIALAAKNSINSTASMTDPTVASFEVPGQADAMHCVTAGGLFVPAPFDGSGMMEAPRKAYEFHLVDPHTGIIYTPPKFSDHLPVSLLLRESEGCGAGACTRECVCACTGVCLCAQATSGAGNHGPPSNSDAAVHSSNTRIESNSGICMCTSTCVCTCTRANMTSGGHGIMSSQCKLPRDIVLDKNHAGTRRTQPFAAQKKLTSFFVATTTGVAVSNANIHTNTKPTAARGNSNDVTVVHTGLSSPAAPALAIAVDVATSKEQVVQADGGVIAGSVSDTSGIKDRSDSTRKAAITGEDQMVQNTDISRSIDRNGDGYTNGIVDASSRSNTIGGIDRETSQPIGVSEASDTGHETQGVALYAYPVNGSHNNSNTTTADGKTLKTNRELDGTVGVEDVRGDYADHTNGESSGKKNSKGNIERSKFTVSSRDQAAIFAARMMDKSLRASERRGQQKRKTTSQTQLKPTSGTKRGKTMKQTVLGSGKSSGNMSDGNSERGGSSSGMESINRLGGKSVQRKAKSRKKSGGVQGSLMGFFGT